MNRGVPPTEVNARTGELTPPGMAADARAKRAAEVSVPSTRPVLQPGRRPARGGAVGWVSAGTGEEPVRVGQEEDDHSPDGGHEQEGHEADHPARGAPADQARGQQQREPDREHGEHDPARRERIARIQECVGSLDRLFTELLDLSRLDSGALKLAPVRFPLDKLFQEISQTFRPIAEDRELRLVLRKTGLWVDADRAMLSQVLNNLVSNAIRYTREGGVLVGARRRGSQVRIDVWDTGIGIAPEHQAQVFDEFFQVSTGSQRASRGLGLGLATVKRLCQVMQVPIQLRSHPGRGTVFNLLLPGSAPGPSEPVAPPAGASVDLAGLPVIVIDDERAILDGIEWLMKSWGCDVRCAETIEQARALLAAGSAAPELLISDLRLREGHNGIEAIRQLRQDSRTCFGQEPAALLVTGETSPDRLREIAGAGVPVLHKPVLPERLREAVASTLAARRAAVT